MNIDAFAEDLRALHDANTAFLVAGIHATSHIKERGDDIPNATISRPLVDVLHDVTVMSDANIKFARVIFEFREKADAFLSDVRCHDVERILEAQAERDRAQALVHAVMRGMLLAYDTFLKDGLPDRLAIAREMEKTNPWTLEEALGSP